MYFVSVQVCKQFSCPKVTYYFCSKEVQVAPAKNAFAVLMQSQRERRLPAKVSSDKLRGDQRMFNDVVDMLGAMNIGWTPDLVGSVGENCVKVIVSALWYIDPCRKQFVERCIHLPSVLDPFEGYNDWKAKKEKKPQLSYDGLTLHLEQLTRLLNQPWLFKPSFKQLHDIINTLAECFDKYRLYLKQQSDAWKINQSLLTPARTISESIELTCVPVVKQCDSRYSIVQAALEEKAMYCPVFLNELAPEDRHQRRNWVAGLRLTFPVMMYRFMHGNNLGTLIFIWKSPVEGGEATKNAKLVTELNQRQKMYSTREMRRDFIQRYARLNDAKPQSKAVLRNMYKFLTDDSSSARSASEKEVDQRVTKLAEEAFDLDEPEILLDLRRLNGSPNATTFDKFWEELSAYLEEITPAVDDRRHGTALHMPIAISVGDLRDIISERLRMKFPEEEPSLPSVEWIRLQFAPRNPYSSNSLRHTGRFDVKFAVQIRQLRKSHPDSKYVMVLLKYAKEYAVRFSQHLMLASVDDKAIIPVGEPSAAVSTGVRGHHRSLVPSSSFLGALDHDFHTHGVVPSVSLLISIPDTPLDSFFTGQVYVGNKNKVTQPSSPLRHSTELSRILIREACAENSVTGDKSILLLLSDGGPDHRLSYGSVQVTLLALFLRLNLDVLIAVRTCPYQSWTNPAERVMSILNLALQNVSLERKLMDEESEKLVKNDNSVKAVRETIKGHPEMQQKIDESLKPVLDLLNNRFQRMKLKERQFRAADVATEAEMESVFDEVKTIDASLQQDCLQKKGLKKAKDFQNFMDAHCHRSTYAFQLRKCLLDTCAYCSSHPVRMPLEEFNSLCYLPLPILDDTGHHFKPFKQVYGQLPSEKDRPSLGCTKNDDNDEFDKANRKILSSAGRVRAAVTCGDCFKPRCVFSEAALSQEEKVMLCELESSYTCGSILFPPASPYHSSIVTRANLSCRDCVEPQYYSASLIKFKPVCSHCGGPEETLVEDELVRSLKETKQVVRPICFFCRSDGKEPHTWGASSNKKRRIM